MDENPKRAGREQAVVILLAASILARWRHPSVVSWPLNAQPWDASI
jgi:hypothetical protein